MTNLGGLRVLFALLALFVACLGVTAFVLVSRARTRRADGDPGVSPDRITVWAAVLAVGLSVLSWLAALAFVTPAGIVERLGRPNLVLAVLLLGYTLPAVAGGYVLRGTHRER